ncbi:PREDICTED: probable LRR receptor-like serine/threonine-protein kinase At5g48740 isoform X2 [Prunus mume]|uniref:Probable LRR receptor-like serine/threonine-protein kinase At5g48740 isoform X2 n=1 Tax=Prunus mume TaxID=102107 RepID=A0ABM1LX00_PRUMU|nr:PREDICTED: probable LRR receptor-like serine/threonine-protein kinase At5g48740 isoform X2 [Prunus mume]
MFSNFGRWVLLLIMALEFIGGTLFTLLYDGVKQAMSKSGTFKSLLGDLKSTLDSLVARDIQQIGEHNVELGLPNEEIEGLKMLMEEGVKLVEKLSNFHMWNYCCLNDYSEQIVELDRALKRLLQKLKMQEARDVKEVLVLARQNRDKLDEVNRRLLDIQKLLQERAGDVTESSVSGGNAETVREQSQGNVTSFDGGTSLQAVFVVLFDVVIEVKDKTTVFKPLLGDLKSTLDSLKPLIEEIAKHNKVLDRPKEELENFRNQMEMGVELIRKCSKVRLWSSCKQYKYRDKLLGLDESLQKLLNILKVQVARDVKETLVSVKNIEAVIQKIEGSGLVQDQIQTKGWGALPEPLSPRVGLDLVNVQGTRDVKETLVSARNTKAVVDKIEGSGAVQNQRAAENHSRNIDSNASRSRGSEFSEAVTRRMDKSQSDGKILETSNLRIFSFSELKAATRNFRGDTMVGEGEYGQVFKGLVYEKTLAPSKVGIGSPVAIKKLNPGSAKGFQDWQSVVNFLGKLSHPSLVKLLGYCWEDYDLLLVYEFMPRGSLENYIFRKFSFRVGRSSTEPLSWDSRLKIAIGAARGLAFLHTSEVQIIYRDFKTSNILLDENYNARISDFGMAELGPIFVESHVSTRIVGTYAYAAPEYFGTGHVTTKSNVYCFGVVLLEILTGFQALDRRRPIEQQNLVEWAKPLLSHETQLKTIMDPGIEGQCSLKAALQTGQIILKCLKLDPKSRPSMKEVVEALEHVQEIKE